MRLLRYDDGWHIWNFSAAILGLMLGELQPTSEGAYAATVASVHG